MGTMDEVADKYKSLRFNSLGEGLASLITKAEENELSLLHFAESLVDHEITMREDRRIRLNMKRAGFPVVKLLEEFDFKIRTTVTKRQIISLMDFSFIENRQNLIFIGVPGVGKTHLSISIGFKAVEAGYRVLFTTAVGLVEMLDLAELKRELKKKITAISKFDVLIIDELGYLPMNRKSIYHLFQLINALYEYRSIILTTNKDFTSWSDFFMEDNVAVPIVDRLIHHSHIFMMGGESYRLKEKTKN